MNRKKYINPHNGAVINLHIWQGGYSGLKTRKYPTVKEADNNMLRNGYLVKK